MKLILLLLSLSVIAFFVLSFILAKIEKVKLSKEHIDISYPSFGTYTSRCEFKKSPFETDVILVNSDTGKILIGGSTYNMSEITKCEARTNEGGVVTTYEDKTYLKTNTGSAIGRAVVGGVVAGGIGALVGASTANKEIKTETVKKNTYINKSHQLYLEENNVRVLFPPKAISEQEIQEVASFINSEINDYKKKMLK